MKRALIAVTMLSLASGVSAQLLGTDALFEMINDPDHGILRNCPAATSGSPPLTYNGTGSSLGESQMRDNSQEIAPMSRFLNALASNTCRSADSGCYLHSLEALSIFANANSTDGNGGAACDTVTFSRTLPNSGYVVNDWRSALRLIYGGIETQIVDYDPCALAAAPRTLTQKDCASPVRAELISSWGNLFEGTCDDTDCSELKHAFRPDDYSDSTDVFLELLALPPTTSTPFCNGTETQDLDPVRRACTGAGRSANDGEQVCQTNGTLGVVLPLTIPTSNPYLTNNAPRDRGGVDCGSSWEADQVAPFCSASGLGGTFQRVANPPGFTGCPIGISIGATCLWPKRSGSAPGTGFDCIVSKANLPASIPAGSVDARAWNLFPRRSNGNPITYLRGTTNRIMSSAYYRLHMTSQLAAGDRPSVVVGATTRTQGCAFANAREQMGCLIEASPCSIGLALSATDPGPACGSAANRRELALETPAGGAGVAPAKTMVRRAVDPSGAACASGAGDFDIRYPLSRPLWLCTLDGLPSPAGVGTTTGAQSVNYVSQQGALAQCFRDRAIVDEAANAVGFITLDDTGLGEVGFYGCP
jgi:hypothetical protein